MFQRSSQTGKQERRDQARGKFTSHSVLQKKFLCSLSRQNPCWSDRHFRLGDNRKLCFEYGKSAVSAVEIVDLDSNPGPSACLFSSFICQELI